MSSAQGTGRGGSAALACMITGAMLIGTNGLMVRYAELPPTVSAFYRMLFAGIILLAMVWLAGQWRALPRRVWLWTLVPAIAFACDLWVWHRSILLIGPGLATLLANTQVFFMALAGLVLFGERVSLRFMSGLSLAFFGLWLILGGDWNTIAPEYRWGVWFGVLTGFCYAIHNIGLKRSQQEARLAHVQGDPIAQVLAIVALGAAGLLGLAGIAEGVSWAFPTLQSFLWVLLLAGLGHCLSWVLISRAMAGLGVALVGLLLLLQPLVAFLLDVALLDRVTSGKEWLGLAFSLAGIFVAGIKARPRAVVST